MLEKLPKVARYSLLIFLFIFLVSSGLLFCIIVFQFPLGFGNTSTVSEFEGIPSAFKSLASPTKVRSHEEIFDSFYREFFASVSEFAEDDSPHYILRYQELPTKEDLILRKYGVEVFGQIIAFIKSKKSLEVRVGSTSYLFDVLDSCQILLLKEECTDITYFCQNNIVGPLEPISLGVFSSLASPKKNVRVFISEIPATGEAPQASMIVLNIQ